MSRPIRRAGAGPRRRGSTYVLVLTMSMLMVTIAVAGLAADRIRDRRNRIEQDWQCSGLLAEAAVERVIQEISVNPWWREELAAYESQFSPKTTLGAGAMSWRIEDLQDDDLDDEPGDPVRIHGLGSVGTAVRVYSVMAWPTGAPLDALRTAVHATGSLEAQGVLDVRVGPASCNGTMTGDHVLGDVEADVVDPGLTVSGSTAAPAPIKTLPPAAIWDIYRSSSTDIPWGATFGTVEKVVISPARNPYDMGKLNADGLYRIKTPTGVTLRIREARIEGTLLVELGNGASLDVGPQVLWRPARPDYPALIVRTKGLGGDVDFTCAGDLDEFLLGTNFNPPDTPYFGDADSDLSDTYPAALSGVFHVLRDAGSTGTVTVDAPNRLAGCILVDGDVTTKPGSVLMADPGLLSLPPLGYTTFIAGDNLLANGGMENGPGAWSPVGAPTTIAYENGGHSGATRLRVGARNAASHGVQQDVTGLIESGRTYVTDVWIEMRDDPEDVRIVLKIDSSGEGTQSFIVEHPDVQKDWTRVTVEHTPTWTGTLNYARWIVRTTTSSQDFHVDDAWLTASQPGPPAASMLPVPGTWRAEEAPGG